MGIVRTVEWSLSVSPAEAERRLHEAMASLGMQAHPDGATIRATSTRSLLKNRWAAEVSVDLSPMGAGTRATCRVEMAGSKHYAVLDELAEAVGDDAFEDRGVGQAIERLGKASRMFGRKEVRHLRHLVHADEQVIALAQGTYEKKQGIVALTDQRLFFFEKSLGSESLEEFGLSSISSLEVGKKMTGEKLVIHASGNRAEITGVMHGQADEVARQFRSVKQRASAPTATGASPEPDVLEQIRKLGELRDAGVLTLEEFEAKKAALLDRL
jgi:Bacterial PH domain/Short C-terminal domain